MSARLIDRLAQGWITAWGPAAEHPQSPLYEPDGYWRGPIWAPTTMLLWDGLLRQNRPELAADIARRFCYLCETSGMAENFDALTQGWPARPRLRLDFRRLPDLLGPACPDRPRTHPMTASPPAIPPSRPTNSPPSPRNISA